MAFLKDAITRTVPLSPFPPFLIPHSLAYKQAYEIAGRRNLLEVGAAAAGSGLWQLAFPATAGVREHIVDSTSPLHERMDRSMGPMLLATGIDAMGILGAVLLAPHMPQLHVQIPGLDQSTSSALTSFAEAKLVVNAATNIGFGALEADLKNQQR